MTATTPVDSIAIDTNVFEHLLNPQENVCGHIDVVLKYLEDCNATLISDSKGRIEGEYDNRLGRLIECAPEGPQRQILEYWINVCHRYKVDLKFDDQLMGGIESVIREPKETVDRIFVYVAFKSGRHLITNDRLHIVDGPEKKKGHRRAKLLKILKKRGRNIRAVDILTSCEAYTKFSAKSPGASPPTL